MKDQENNIHQANLNNYPNYYNQTDNINSMNEAKKMIKSFRNQFLNNNEKAQKVISTEDNIQGSKIPASYGLSLNNKEREEFNDYDYFFGSGRKQNLNSPIRNQIIENQNDNFSPDLELIDQENKKLRRQIMDLVNENQALQNKINNNNIDYSPILFSDNRLNNFQSIEKPEKVMILEKTNNNLNKMNNIKIMNNNILNNNNIENNPVNVPLADQKFMEESIASIIKTNMNLDSNKKEKSKKNSQKIKKVGGGNTKDNKIYIRNNNYNNNINFDEYLKVINNYNQLLEDYNNVKIKYENLQKEVDNKKAQSNKYQTLNSNYSDLQKRNKELVITVQKMRSDNIILTKHIEEMGKHKKNLESKINKLKKNMNNGNENELRNLRYKNAQMNKIVEEVMKERDEYEKNEKKKKKVK